MILRSLSHHRWPVAGGRGHMDRGLSQRPRYWNTKSDPWMRRLGLPQGRARGILERALPQLASVPRARPFSTYYSVPTRQGAAKINVERAPHFVGHHTSRCMRQYNEDRYFLGFLDLPIARHPQPVFNAAVFDGHGGDTCSEFLRANLASYVEDADPPSLLEQLPELYREKFGGYWRTAKLASSRHIKQLMRSKYDDFALRLPMAYLAADFDELKTDEMAGSTCTSAYIYTLDPDAQFWTPGVQANLTVAQVGDTRALICDNQGNFLGLNTIHHADSVYEADRLHHYQFGFNTTTDGLQRFLQYVNTRSFGDFQGKSRGISAEPDLVEYQLGPGRGRLAGEEAFLVLVTDGVTDYASDQEICDLVIQTAASGGSHRGTPQSAALEIVSYVGMLGTSDNATALVVRLGGWGDWSHWRDRSGSQRVRKLKQMLRRQ